MLENFTPEEVEQIKRELGIPPGTATRKPLISDESEQKLLSLGLREIDGKDTSIIPSITGEYGACIRKLVDLAICNYSVGLAKKHKKIELRHSPNVPTNCFEKYREICEKLIDFLCDMKKENEQVFSENRDHVIAEWRTKATDENTRPFEKTMWERYPELYVERKERRL